MNYSRVMTGGLLSGLLLSILGFTGMHLFFIHDFVEALQVCNIALAPSAAALFEHVAMRLIVGIVLVWLCAAIRPRFGPGPRSAFIAAGATWYLAYVHSAWAMGSIGFLPGRLLALSTAWGLMEVLLAALAGAWLYREG